MAPEEQTKTIWRRVLMRVISKKEYLAIEFDPNAFDRALIYFHEMTGRTAKIHHAAEVSPTWGGKKYEYKDVWTLEIPNTEEKWFLHPTGCWVIFDDATLRVVDVVSKESMPYAYEEVS